ncbi:MULTISPECIES: ParA family protein [Streptococcus]|uniref:ParA family protein n=1 Tax=Streptococcus TaxID=1301 RepID=UPI000CF4C8AB|nr:ParA family protein [Streptococcus suis]MBM0195985.1 ParA family protein [Streptococcus suis]MBM7317452.1 ParA family protein [Streptococcus suis]NQM01959.1 ParA family protein [Streptococcus suis]HEM2785972.1 ParA family protein [Streptococcus suis]HEM4137517.1 ParA family protein [Streptococcus suis]
MRIISFSAIKGGVGKTTLAFNYGEWLARQGKNILFIDLDHQCNLTQTYNIFETRGTVADIFRRTGAAQIINVKPGISIIPGYMQLDVVERDLENKANKDMLLYMWFSDNYTTLSLNTFDYVIIDCHPDFATATRNAVAVSHSIISPLTPSEHGYNAKFNIEERLEAFRDEVFDYTTRESYITAKLYFVANMIAHNKNSSRDLLEKLEGDSRWIASVPNKELFNKSTLEKKPISDMKQVPDIFQAHKKFFEDIEMTFQNISDII